MAFSWFWILGRQSVPSGPGIVRRGVSAALMALQLREACKMQPVSQNPQCTRPIPLWWMGEAGRGNRGSEAGYGG